MEIERVLPWNFCHTISMTGCQHKMEKAWSVACIMVDWELQFLRGCFSPLEMDVLQWQHVASLGCWGRAMCAGARWWRPGKWWRPYFSNMGCHLQQQWGCCGQCFWGFNCQGIDNHTRWMWGNWGIFSSGELYNLVGLVDYPIHAFCRINSLLCKALVMFSGFL
jgi:hypothetical protein